MRKRRHDEDFGGALADLSNGGWRCTSIVCAGHTINALSAEFCSKAHCGRSRSAWGVDTPSKPVRKAEAAVAKPLPFTIEEGDLDPSDDEDCRHSITGSAVQPAASARKSARTGLGVAPPRLGLSDDWSGGVASDWLTVSVAPDSRRPASGAGAAAAPPPPPLDDQSAGGWRCTSVICWGKTLNALSATHCSNSECLLPRSMVGIETPSKPSKPLDSALPPPLALPFTIAEEEAAPSPSPAKAENEQKSASPRMDHPASTSLVLAAPAALAASAAQAAAAAAQISAAEARAWTADAQRGIADRFALALPECFGFGVERRSKATPPPRGKRPAGSGVRSPVI